MKELKKVSIFIFIIFALLVSNNKVTFANKYDVYEEILSLSSASVIESGIKVRFTTLEENMDIVYKIKNKLETIDKSMNISIDKERKYIEFNGEILYGFIDYSSKEDAITVQIIEKSKDISIESLKAMVMNIINNKIQNMESFECIKASLPNDVNLQNLNIDIEKKLSTNDCKNIDSIELNNGYSSLINLNTERENQINYALCSYTSGKYLIIGTPEIIIPY